MLAQETETGGNKGRANRPGHPMGNVTRANSARPRYRPARDKYCHVSFLAARKRKEKKQTLRGVCV